jgi:signal transduction histidine kinase
MSEIVRTRTTFADALATVPDWFRPLRFSRGPGSIVATTLCILLLAGVLGADLVTPGLSLGSLAVLPVVAATWLLSGRLAALVTILAIVNRLLSGALGGVPALHAGAEAITIGVVALTARVAAVYVAATRSARERSDLLARVARIATSADSIQQTLDQILQEMARDGLRGGLIGLIDERGEIYPAAAEGDIDDTVWNLRIPLGQGIMGTAAAEGRSILVNDLDAPDLPVPPIHRRVGSNARIKSLVVVPLLAAGRAIGVLELDSDRTGRFDERDVAVLEQVALAVSDAVQREGALQLADRLRLEQARTRELGAHAERMAELEKVKADFLKVASHELRSPLAVLKGYISMLSDGSIRPDSASMPHILEVITAKLGEVSELVEQMLETARLEDSRLHLQLERQDLGDIVAEAVERVRPRALNSHKLVVAMSAEAVYVLVDRGRVVTILTNLLDNALKYSPEGGDIRAAVCVTEDVARVSVSDAGLGLAEEDLPRLFTRFGRILTVANSHIPGTGLGLYLARELARMHGGDIQAKSREGVGSTFTLTIPVLGPNRAASSAIRPGTGLQSA